MKKWFIVTIFVTILLFFAPGNLTRGWAEAEDHSVPASHHIQKGKDVPQKVGKGRIDTDFGNIPLYFIPNKGQMNEKALFCAKTNRYTLWLTKQGLVFDSIKKTHPAPSGHPSQEGNDALPHSPHSLKTDRDVSRLIFLNANKQPVVVPEKPTDHRVNYFKGKNRSCWFTGIPTSKVVSYKNLYKNIDLKVYGIEKQIEYDWVVKPGGDPRKIRFQYQGVEDVSIDEEGNLVVRTAFGKWSHKRPVSCQVIAGKKIPVEASFKSHGNHTFGFKVNQYNKDYALIIDPMVLAFSSYLGGSDGDGINDMTTNGSGAMVVTGDSWSTDFPTASGCQETLVGMGDVVVTKFSPDGTGLVFSTYLGGSSWETGNAIILDGSGLVYVVGFTNSNDFPTVNPYQGSQAGNQDGFIAKLSADGGTLLYSTYFGGSDMDEFDDAAVNGSGEIYASGWTVSTDLPLQDPIQSSWAGGADAFIIKLSSTGASLVFSTYLGGSSTDIAWTIDLDSSGAAYIGGESYSTDFPTVNAFQPDIGSATRKDGILAKISADGSTLVYSTYLGGDKEDEVADIYVDNSGAVYMIGSTYSTNFPTTSGVFQEVKPSDWFASEAFIAKLSSSGASLVFSTYLGGSSDYTWGYGIDVGVDGKVYVSGSTGSTSFPLVDAIYGYVPQGYDIAFVTEFSPDVSTVNFSSYFGGPEAGGHAINVDNTGNIYLAGYCMDGLAPYQGFQAMPGGNGDGFVGKIVYSAIAEITVNIPNGSEDWPTGSTQYITWTAPAVVKNIAIYYTCDGGENWDMVTESTPNTGSYTWNIPLTPSSMCKVGINDADMGSTIPADESDAYFTISAARVIDITSPIGGENWYGNSVHDITWDYSGMIDYVSIDYSIDGGNNWTPVATSIANSGTYSWTVPDTPSSDCLVRVSDDGSAAADTSDNVFTISPASTAYIEVTVPNGSESWSAGSTYDITWDDSGTVANVNIDYSIDGGSNWTPIVSSLINTNTYSWTVPDTPSGNCLVKVSEDGGTLTDTSDAPFTIWVPEIPPSERDALIALYNSTDGDNWKLNSNWRKPGDPSQFNDPGTENTWYGVTCNPDNTHVIKITLQSNDLVGTLPDLSALTELEEIRMSGNQLSDNIPATLNTLTKLRHLGLNVNQFSGPIPDLSGLTQLEKLAFNMNNLTGGVPAWLNTLPNLAYIFLFDNQFTGPIPDLSSLTNLELLELSENDLTGPVPTWLTSLPNLRVIHLDWNQLTGTVPDLSSMTQLTSLNLNANQLTGTIPDLSPCINLTYLNLAQNDLTGSVPTWLNTLTALKHLYLYGNQLSGDIPYLGSLNSLETLSLSANQLTGTIPTWINSLPSLVTLGLFNNQLTGTIPNMSSLSNLRTALLRQNQLTGTIPAWFNNLTELVTLDLGYNQLTGSIPDLSSLTKLRDFWLNDNQLSGSLPAWLNNITTLRVIILDSNQFSGTIPDLNNLSNLENLHLDHNQFTGNIPDLSGCSALKYLGINSNQFTGNIPDLSGCSALKYLGISSNQLSGSMPGFLVNLTTLYDNFSDFRWNALYTTDSNLRDFLNSKQSGGDWESTQAIAPTGVSTSEITENSIKVSWTPITYQGDTGGYNVYYSTTSGSGYTLAGATADKTVDNYTVTDLADNTVYYFVVETFTDPHNDNQNTVTSEYSTEVSAATLEARSITIITPNGTESWEGNTIETITWNSIGTITDVKIEYSTDNGASWETIVASTANTGSYDWTVPNTPSTNCLVKITDIASSTTDTSDGVFTILEQRTVTVMSPNGTEEWFVGDGYDITWTSTGAVGTVSIDYSINSGSSWNSITSSTNNTGTYNWTVPNTPSSECLVRISDTAGPAVDTSNGVFTISPRIPQAERDVLIALYNSTNGDSWYNNTNWRNPGDPLQFNDPGTEHTWYGVTCNAEKNHVLEVNLYQNGLSGTIPDLSALTELVTLNLGINQVSGPIPTSLHNLTNLTTLKLEVNQLSGTIPDLSNLTNLVELNLTLNELAGTIPSHLNNLVNLKWLYLNENQLSGVIPDLSNLTQLEHLYLNGNQLTGSIPAHLNNLTILVRLHLNNNQLSGTIPVLSNLTQLTHLNLNTNQLTGSIPDWLNNLTNLVELYLMANDFSGVIPDLSNLTQLLHFAASYNDLTGGLESLANLTQLLTIYLSNNHLSGSIPSELGNLTNLLILRLHGNQLTGQIPGTLSNLTNLDNDGLNIKWNGLYTTNTGLRDFLNSKQDGGDWESTQTIAPTDVSTSEASHDSVKVSWAPIQYQADAGGYRIYYSTTPGSGYILAGSADNKSLDNYTVTGLEALTTYYFVVEAFTIPHSYNFNHVVSEYSPEVSTTTLESPTITVSAPNGGQSWEATTAQNITWNSTGNITDVKVEYSTDNGSSWSTVIASTPNNGSYNWMVPNTPSTNCLVKITDIGGLAEDTSDAVFTIAEQRTITVTAPNGTENWEGGTNQNITWNSTGSIPNVKIEYSTDNGGSWNTISDSTANNGSYSWTVPNTPSTNCLVRVSDTAGPASDTSDAVFTIAEQRTITVTAPNGTENWEGGTNQNITWNSTGSISNVKIEYSTDSGGSWNTISDSTANNGSYSWTVPNTPSTNCLVKVSDTAGPASDISNGVFTIAEQRTITVTAPNGTENWEGGTIQNITWNSTGSIVNVMIEYSTDNGSSWSTITSSTANSGSYNWTVPNTPSNSCLVKISDTAGPATDTSDAVFTIAEQRTITVTVPNDGESWQAGTNQTITWISTGNIVNVGLEYSTDGGSSWNTIASSTANSGSYSWDVPNDPSDNCLVKISDTGGPAWDESDMVFSITPPAISSTERDALIALYNSTDGDNWTDNTNWRKPGDPTQFNDPGTEHTWHGVTCDAGITHVIGINLFNNNLVGTIPAELNNISQLTTLNLSWNQLTGNIPNLGSLTKLTSLNFSSNQLTGNIPALINNLTDLTTLHLGHNQLSGVIPDLSSLINLTNFNLGVNQLTGTIPAWINNFVNLATLDLQNNQLTGAIPDLGNLTNLTFLNFDDNQLSGNIPAWINNLTQLTNLHLAFNQLTGVIPDLSSLAQLSSLNLSHNQLTGTIPAALGILTTLTSLRLNENLLQGNIPPELGNLTALRYLYLDANQLEGSIPSQIGNLTSLDYLYLKGNQLVGSMPGTLSDLTNLNTNGLELRWNGLYTDDAGLRDFLNSKQNGGDWESTQTIPPEGVSTSDETSDSVKVSWTPIQYQANGGGYRVYYTTTSGSDYTLAGTTADKSVDNHTVTGLNSEQIYYFVVETVTDSHVYNQSTVVSEYSAEVSTTTLEESTLTITAPNGTENWEVGSNQNITWNSTGSIANVMLEYSADNGSSWSTITGSTTNSGSYNWTVANTPSSNCLVRVSDTAGPATDTSNGVFTIAEQRTLTVTAPNGTESWEGGTTHTVTWNSTGSIANVKIEYSTNNGSSWNTVAASTTNDGNHNWTVPNTPSSNCLVRISDTAGPASDTSDTVFTIAPHRTITVTAPNDGETWEVDSNQTITWTSTGNIVNVRIEYSTDGGSSWNTIASSTANSGSYSWDVPNDPSDNCLVKISDTAGPAWDQSDEVFSIKAILFETGVVTGVGNSWQTVTLQYTYTSMVVVCSSDLGAAALPTVCRVRNASGNSFDLMVQNPSGSALSGYDVHYLVIEEGVYIAAYHGVKMEAVKVTSTATAGSGSWTRETRSYSNSYTSPVVLGQVMTYNDAGWSVFWACSGSRSNPPTSGALSAGKHVGEDTDRTRNNETIGYIVLEAGDGIIDGIPYTAAVGTDIVRGPDNTSTGYTYNFSSIPTASTAIISAAGMDGGNGGWPVFYGNSPLTSTSLTMVFDEDQIKDSERKHNPEQVAYAVFGTQ